MMIDFTNFTIDCQLKQFLKIRSLYCTEIYGMLNQTISDIRHPELFKNTDRKLYKVDFYANNTFINREQIPLFRTASCCQLSLSLEYWQSLKYSIKNSCHIRIYIYAYTISFQIEKYVENDGDYAESILPNGLVLDHLMTLRYQNYVDKRNTKKLKYNNTGLKQLYNCF